MPHFDRETLQDLVAHAEWADTEIWNAVAAAPRALDDVGIRDYLHHIHMVQRLFVALWSRQPPDAIVARQPSEFTLSDLRAWAGRSDGDAKAFLQSATPARLAEPLTVRVGGHARGGDGPDADGADGRRDGVPGGEPHHAPPRPGQRAAARSRRGAAARGLHRLGVVRAAGTAHGTVIALTGFPPEPRRKSLLGGGCLPAMT